MKNHTKTHVIILTKLIKDGIGSMTINILKMTNHNDFKFTIVTDRETDSYYDSLCKKMGIDIISLPNRKKHPLHFYRNLRRTIKQSSCDILHINGNSALMLPEVLIGKKCKVKKIITHCHNTSCNHKIFHYISRPLFNALPITRLACGTDAGKWAYGTNHFTVIKNGIETSRFAYNPNLRLNIRHQYNIKDSTFVIGHIGHFNQTKNQKYLIDLLENLYRSSHTDIKLMLIGNGEEYNNIKAYASKMNCKGNIIFTGIVNNPSDYYNAFDLFAMPSLHEGMPITLIEAQANGINCLVSTGITKEINYTNHCKYLSLAEKDTWVKAILESKNSNKSSRNIQSKNNIEILKKNGYDITTSVKNLERKYI